MNRLEILAAKSNAFSVSGSGYGLVPIGTTFDFPYPAECCPPGFLICGQDVSRASYKALHALSFFTLTITVANGGTTVTTASTANLSVGFALERAGLQSGTKIATIVNSTQFTINKAATAAITNGSVSVYRWGNGDGSTTFALPPNGVVFVGKNTETEFNTVGKTGGEKAHVLTIDEMPSHHHTNSDTYNVQTCASGTGATACDEIERDENTSDVGGGLAHNNLQPYAVVLKIIKY